MSPMALAYFSRKVYPDNIKENLSIVALKIPKYLPKRLKDTTDANQIKKYVSYITVIFLYGQPSASDSLLSMDRIPPF